MTLTVPVLEAGIKPAAPLEPLLVARRNAATHCFSKTAVEIAAMGMAALNRLQRAGRKGRGTSMPQKAKTKKMRGGGGTAVRVCRLLEIGLGMVVALWAGFVAGAQGGAFQVQAEPPKYVKVNIMTDFVTEIEEAEEAGEYEEQAVESCMMRWPTTRCRAMLRYGLEWRWH